MKKKGEARGKVRFEDLPDVEREGITIDITIKALNDVIKDYRAQRARGEISESVLQAKEVLYGKAMGEITQQQEARKKKLN